MPNTTTFIYINSLAAEVADNHRIKNFLNKKIGNKSWQLCHEVLIPEQLEEQAGDVINEDFFHGIATHQFTLMKDGGVFINPFLYGLNSNVLIWTDIIHDSQDFFQNTIYIDIPYDLFKEAAKDTVYFCDEEEYTVTSDHIKGITEGINKKYYPESLSSLH